MNKLLTFLTAGTVFLLLAVPLYAQGRSAQAPGQANKTNSPNNKKSEAVVGSVENITPTTVTVEDKKSKKKTEATIDATTQILGQDRKLLKVGAIKLKSLMALISSDSAAATDGGKLRIKKIFVKEASQSAQLKRRAVHGVITEINGNVLTLAHQIQRDRTFTVTLTPDTIIKFKSQKSRVDIATGSAEASSSATPASLEVGLRIVAMGDLDPAGGIIAKRIHIIPGRATGIFKRLPVATPGASLKPSPTGTPSASATPSASPVTPSATPVASP